MKIKILGSRYTKISADRDLSFDGKIEVDQNINIKEIKEYDKKNSLVVDYIYNIDYKKLGKIEIDGILYLELEEGNVKKVVKDWKAKKIDPEDQLAIINLIIHKASIKALQLEEELGLPIHFRLPTLQNKK